jgi:hydroxyacyl-ACP dehydratase HTD2-like protein with hotdog domain
LAAQVHGWSPRPVERVDELQPSASGSLRDLLASGPAPHDGDRVDPLHHWVYFQSWPPVGSLGPDGHPRSGGFLPPFHDRRRMVAGGRCTFHAPLHFGQSATATSSLVHSEVKQANSGELLLVTVRTAIEQSNRLCVTDEQDFVYRSGPPQALAGATPRSQPPARRADIDVTRRRRTTFDAVTLFRFSALSANSHRIHYDGPYARDVEGYAGLLVHGPLLVLSMVEFLVGSPAPELATLSYRLHRPVLAGEAVDIAISGGALARAEVRDPSGGLRVSADAQFDHGTAGQP